MTMSILKYSLIIASMAFVFSACRKDDNNSANNNTVNSTNGKTSALFNSTVTYDTMSDQDGNIYKTVIIGSQTWMAENLRTTKYNEGSSIPYVSGNDKWPVLTSGAYCNTGNTLSDDTIATYGRLYNWYAVNTGRLAPVGWHVPSLLEWMQLIDYIDETATAGVKLKETGSLHWSWHHYALSTNESGFTALPGGSRKRSFHSVGSSGNFWSSTLYFFGVAWYTEMVSTGNYAVISSADKESGFSVRCVKD
ncbi:MAG: fibrobacter succinogenes major paralogous domain-containing protein [Bacteroidales bacterium]|nr:fibrobacter succinogenes major paralogous domain-containing protein [Bacteroidales bacterium]